MEVGFSELKNAVKKGLIYMGVFGGHIMVSIGENFEHKSKQGKYLGKIKNIQFTPLDLVLAWKIQKNNASSMKYSSKWKFEP